MRKNGAQRSQVARARAEARRCPKCGRGSAIVSVRPRPTEPGEVTEYCRWDDCNYGRMIPFLDVTDHPNRSESNG